MVPGCSFAVEMLYITTHTFSPNEAQNTDKIFRAQRWCSVYPLMKMPVKFLHMRILVIMDSSAWELCFEFSIGW